MAIAFQQSKSVDGGTVTSATLAFTSNVTAASLLVHALRIGANGRTLTVTDTKSNTYATALAALSDGQGDDFAAFYAMNALAGATTVQVAISGAAALIRFAIHEYSGIATSGALDQQTRQIYANTTTPDSGSVITTQASELLWGALEEGQSTVSSFTAGTGYNKREQLVITSVLKVATEDQISVSTGTYSASFTLNSSANAGAVGIATFKAAAAGGTAIRVLYQYGYDGTGGGVTGQNRIH